MNDSQKKRKTHSEDLEAVRNLARLLDESIRVPGTQYHIGLDGIIGLLPGFGDAATAIISGYIIYQAHRHHLTKLRLLRMYSNVGIDLLIGSIPVLGDIFDMGWKSNTKNVKILQKHLESGNRETSE